MQAIGYVRVSTAEQADSGLSIENQVAKLRSYAVVRELDLVDIIIDAGVSGGKALAAREGGAKVLRWTKRNPGCAVVTLKLDRMFRDAANCLTVTKVWDAKGTAFHILDMGGTSIDTSSAMGRMFLTMAAGFAELERGLIRERTSAALAVKRERGEKTGGASCPFGYRLAKDGVHLVEAPAEQEALALILKLREDGFSYGKIAAELNLKGYMTKAGSEWKPVQVRRVCKRAAA